MATLRCPSCGAESPASETRFECACGDLFDVEHVFRPVDRELFDARLGRAKPPLDSGVWRFRELVYHRFPSSAVISLREGGTPLYRLPSASAYAGIEELSFKHEGLNPTGSFKDRGMTVAVSRAVASGARTVACASTGNTAASLAAYAAAAGLASVVLAPERGTALGKLSQALAYGARTLLVRGDFDAAMALVRELARDGSLALVNSLNPFRIEGQKSIVFELLQDLGWEPPDWIVFPAGNLGNCAAFGKALREARAVGLIDRTPRLAAVQAAGAAPFVRAFRADFAALEPVRAETVASAIRIGDPVSYRRAVRALRETQGVAIEVDDAAILEAKRVIDRAGVGAEPASCAALAGARKLALRGVIDLHERVVCVLTGHLLKDPETTLALHRGELPGVEPSLANVPIVIEPTIDALRGALRRTLP